jgi:ethanolamine transporter EutH
MRSVPTRGTGSLVSKMKRLNWKVILVLGLVAGIIQAFAGVVMYVAGVYFSAWSMLVTAVVLILCIVVGTRWYRNNMLGGTLTYSQALVIGVVISVSTGIVYALYNVVSISFFYPNFLTDMIQDGVARIQSSGLSSEQTSELVAAMKRDATIPKIALGNLIRLSIIGAILSTIIAIVLRRKASSEVSI